MTVKDFFKQTKVKIACAIIAAIGITGLVIGGVAVTTINSGVEKVEAVVSTFTE